MRAAFGIVVAACAALAAQTQLQINPAQLPGRPVIGIPPQARPAETGTASIEGAVIDSLTHNPIPKANVNLNGRSSLAAVTGADGRFAFRQLPAGQYVVQAQSEKYPMGQFSLELGRQASVTVAADEQKTGVTLTLTPGASVRGRIVDEEGTPMQPCFVSANRFRLGDPNPGLAAMGSAQTDEKGEYSLEKIPAGKYYFVARCSLSIPMPHALVRRDLLNTLPTLTYPPLFYPGSAELSGATRVSLTAGANLSGLDFQMTPIAGVSLRGRVRGVSPGLVLQLTLRPRDAALRPAQQQGARPDPTTGEFRIASVRPGSYELVAAGQGEGHAYYGKTAVEVGTAAPEPVEVVLQPVPQISGSISIESDPQPRSVPTQGNPETPFKNLRVMMNPLEPGLFGPRPQEDVQSDGTFTMAAAPGRWRLQVNGAPGYLKSVTLGDQEVSATSLELGSAPGALKIVISTKYAQVDASVPGLPPDGGPVSAVVWSADGTEFQQSIPLNPQGRATLNLPPGRYHACAIAAAQPYLVLQNRDFRRALEGSCPVVEVSEGSRSSIQMTLIPSEEVKRLADRLEADDAP